MKLNALFEGFSIQLHKQHNETSDDESNISAISTKRLAKWENEKYRMLLDDSIQWEGHTLYRVQYKIETRYAAKGVVGGYIESLDNLSEEGYCVVLDNAKVWGDAKVYGDAAVYDNAQVYDNAEVYGIYPNKPYICGNSKIHGDAKIHGNIFIRDKDIVENV